MGRRYLPIEEAQKFASDYRLAVRNSDLRNVERVGPLDGFRGEITDPQEVMEYVVTKVRPDSRAKLREQIDAIFRLARIYEKNNRLEVACPPTVFGTVGPFSGKM